MKTMKSNIPLKTETRARQHGVAKVPADRAQWILLHHSPDSRQLLDSLLVVDTGIEGEALGQREISPVDALGSVGIIGTQEIGKNGLLVLSSVDIRKAGVVVAGLRAIGDRDDALVGGVVMIGAGEEVCHGGGGKGGCVSVCLSICLIYLLGIEERDRGRQDGGREVVVVVVVVVIERDKKKEKKGETGMMEIYKVRGYKEQRESCCACVVVAVTKTEKYGILWVFGGSLTFRVWRRRKEEKCGARGGCPMPQSY